MLRHIRQAKKKIINQATLKIYLQHNKQFWLPAFKNKKYSDNQFDGRAVSLFELKGTDGQYVTTFKGRVKFDKKWSWLV